MTSSYFNTILIGPYGLFCSRRIISFVARAVSVCQHYHDKQAKGGHTKTMIEPFCRNTSRAAFYWSDVGKKQRPRVRCHMHFYISTAVTQRLSRSREDMAITLENWMNSSRGLQCFRILEYLRDSTRRSLRMFRELLKMWQNIIRGKNDYLVTLSQHRIPTLLPLHCADVWLGCPGHCCSSSFV